MICLYCGSKNVIKCGKTEGMHKNQRFYCKDCGKKFIENVYNNLELNNCKQKVEFERNENNAVGIVTTNKPKKLDEILKLFDIDLRMWSVERVVVNSWDMSTKNGKVYTNYQTKVFLKKIEEIFNYDIIKNDFIELSKKYVPSYKKIKYKEKCEEHNLLEMNISDLHLGKLCWKGETGENYDTKIAQERFLNILNQLIERVKFFDYERILFPVGNDFFNSDNLFNSTTDGTPQDDDLRWQKLYKIGRELLIRAIDFLRLYAPVDVIVIQGNHDFQRMYYLGDSLSLWYSRCEDVTINNEPKTRKYYKYGKVLLGFTHGSDEKFNQLPLIMAQEATDLWSDTKYREVHIGHFHHKKNVNFIESEDFKGIMIRQMGSITGIDAWHAKKGFIGNIKAANAFLWNEEKGLVAIFESHV